MYAFMVADSMGKSDQILSDSMNSLSRRNVLQIGTLGALASGTFDTAEGRRASRSPPERTWELSVETKLDPRITILDDTDVAVTFSDLLAVDEGYLYAFDIKSGNRLWKKSISETPSIRFHDGVLYHFDESTLTALDPRSGAEQWSVTDQFGHPAVFEGEYAAFWGDLGGATVINLIEGAFAWRPEIRSLSDPVTLVDGDLVVRGDREFAAYDVETGEPLWQYVELPPGGLNSTIKASWPYCFITSTEPAETLALDLHSGTASWRKSGSLYPRHFEPTGPDGGVVLATDMGTITALDPTTGEERWAQTLTEELLFLYQVDDELAVPVAEDHLWALSLKDGSVQWEHPMDSPFPIVCQSNETFYAADTSIRTFDRNGILGWEADLTGSESLVPDVSDGHLVATSGSGVYEFSVESESEPTDEPGGGTTDTPDGGTMDTPGRGTMDTPGGGTTDTPSGGTTDTPGRESTDTDGSGPGFGVVSAVVALLGGGAAYLRQKRVGE